MSRPRQQRKSLRAEAEKIADTCMVWNTRLAARRLTQCLERELAPTGLSAAQFGLLMQIATLTDGTLGTLAQRTGLEQSTLSRNLRLLESEGLVTLAADDSDMRRRLIALTETGGARLEAGMAAWRAAHAAMAKHVSPGLVRQLADATASLVGE